MQKKIEKIEKLRENGIPTIPSTLKEELDCNIFLKALVENPDEVEIEEEEEEEGKIVLKNQQLCLMLNHNQPLLLIWVSLKSIFQKAFYIFCS